MTRRVRRAKKNWWLQPRGSKGEFVSRETQIRDDLLEQQLKYEKYAENLSLELIAHFEHNERALELVQETIDNNKDLGKIDFYLMLRSMMIEKRFIRACAFCDGKLHLLNDRCPKCEGRGYFLLSC